jgi:protein-S-isoprenylcysteine O-methyltransferase Ste14
VEELVMSMIPVREKLSGSEPGAKKRGAWLPIAVAALFGATLGARWAMHPQSGSLVDAVGMWAVRHGWVGAGAADAFGRALRQNVDRLLPGIAIYMIFGVYWLIASKDRAEDWAPEPFASSFIHKLLTNLSPALICVPLPGLMQRLLPSTPLWLVIGLAVEVGGAALAVAARRTLGRNWSREVRIAVGHELVRTGPYARIRHPIYTGALCVSLGLTLESGLLSAFVGFGILILAYVRKIALEERLLKRAFGESFDQYRASSWALIPFIL